MKLLPLVVAISAGTCCAAAAADDVFPGRHWAEATPEQVGLAVEKLDALAALAGGRGCVVRHGRLVYAWGDATQSGDVASAVKPVISTLLLLAVQQGKLASVDAPVAECEPRLKSLNAGKDAAISWRHLASQTSGYGLAEPPGTAYSYNDFALALYYDTLMHGVYRQDATHVLKEQLGDPLGFEDAYTFEAFGPDDRPGRLAISPRDLARFGLLYLHGGRWRDRQIVDPALVRLALGSVVPAALPRTSGQEAAMLPGQRSLGGTRNITPVGPGYYSFNWWLNRTDRDGQRLYVDAPPDLFVASGHGGERTLWIVPSLDLVVAWNDSRINDHDACPGNAETNCNRALRLLREAVVRRTRVSVLRDRWFINGQPTYRGAPAEGRMLNVRMVNAVFEDARRPDFDPEANTTRFLAALPDYLAHGVRAITLNLQGGMPGYEGAVNSAFDEKGNLQDGYLRRVRRAIEACDEQGAVVILGCFYQRQDQILQDADAVRAAIVNVAQWIKGCGFTNVALEIANEFGHGGFDHELLKTAAGQVELMQLAKRVHPELLVSTSGLGDGRVDSELARTADFVLIHFNGVDLTEIPARIAALAPLGKPIVCNEDTKDGATGAQAAETCVRHGASWGLMLETINQHYPFRFDGAADDRQVYSALGRLAAP